ncbi:right-handed parallel beta-helix repeat-containing protein [Dysgonomonas sp. Marseille-P4677]|uniref:right-handed parallel beta-helix repeat-containing protein n=1 Tax=Dysgonomonas sp. Marseille-P4677 TaxID=2364790 RepID=UPI001913EE5D|nr:right-handed parallel beta-helix repeat-containing protein [Dysgonomonas sp. Marseille-P4677]MBK5721744.1 right-handed parallel beta-helix repeat-containing protein [Dysgonomonas sp. Marseille-P4677]
MKTIYIHLILLLSVLIFSCSNDDSQTSDTFVINNSKFGISASKTNARQTTDGINRAIEQAKDEGYSIVKLTKGEYLISSEGVTGYDNGNGIFIPNNFTLDLTEAKLYIEPGSKNVHKLIRIDEVENVTIIGGHLVGNKDKYDAENNTEATECAIEINCSKNVTVDGVKMENFRGSAMWIGYGFIAPNEKRLNKNVKIVNCEIFHSSMQGISIIHASNVEIAYNKIYDIGGMLPGCGIDLEPETDWADPLHPWKSWVEYVNIHHNEFKDTQGEGLCFTNHYTTDIEATDNTFDNSAIIVGAYPKRIRLMRNSLKGWESYIVAVSGSVDVYMPLEGSNKNEIEFKQRVLNCSTQTGHIKETDNYIFCY